MKVNKVYKVIRPMRKFGNLIKDIFIPDKSNHFWIRVKESVETTLKMLLQHAELKPHHKGWVIESYKNIVNFRYQNQ